MKSRGQNEVAAQISDWRAWCRMMTEISGTYVRTLAKILEPIWNLNRPFLEPK